MQHILFLILLFLLVSCESKVKVPSKVAGIPEQAIWFGGLDGGQWILYEKYDSSQFRYKCNIYNDYTGDLTATGDFILRKYEWNNNLKEFSYSLLGKELDSLKFSGYDGVSIFLDTSIVLLPDGWIVYPFDSISGKKQLYTLGKEITEEIQY
jgi:hypothetical protein